MRNNIFEFTEAEFYEKFNETIIDITKKCTTNSDPFAWILGGQPGCGKTRLQKILFEDDNNNTFIVINGDVFRANHPHFNEIYSRLKDDWVPATNSFSNRMVEELISYLSDQKYNLIIEGTLRTAEVPAQTAKILQDKGYNTGLAVIAVKPEISYICTKIRYEMKIYEKITARATPKEHHDKVVSALPENLTKLWQAKAFNEIRVYNNIYECIYSSKESQENPGIILNDILNGSWNEQEYNRFKDIYNDTIEIMTQNNSDTSEITNCLQNVQQKYEEGKSHPHGEDERRTHSMDEWQDKIDNVRNSQAEANIKDDKELELKELER